MKPVIKKIRLLTLSCSTFAILTSALYMKLIDQLQPSLIFVFLLLAMTISFQISANCFDDFFDNKTTVSKIEHLNDGLLSLFFLVLASLLGIIIIAFTQTFYLFLIGLLIIPGIIFYAGGKKPLGDHGLGEFMAFIFWGPIAVLGSYYVLLSQYFLPETPLQSTTCWPFACPNLDIPISNSQSLNIFFSNPTIYILSIIVGISVTLLMIFSHLIGLESDTKAKRHNLITFLFSKKVSKKFLSQESHLVNSAKIQIFTTLRLTLMILMWIFSFIALIFVIV